MRLYPWWSEGPVVACSLARSGWRSEFTPSKAPSATDRVQEKTKAAVDPKRHEIGPPSPVASVRAVYVTSRVPRDSPGRMQVLEARVRTRPRWVHAKANAALRLCRILPELSASFSVHLHLTSITSIFYHTSAVGSQIQYRLQMRLPIASSAPS